MAEDPSPAAEEAKPKEPNQEEDTTNATEQHPWTDMSSEPSCSASGGRNAYGQNLAYDNYYKAKGKGKGKRIEQLEQEVEQLKEAVAKLTDRVERAETQLQWWHQHGTWH